MAKYLSVFALTTTIGSSDMGIKQAISKRKLAKALFNIIRKHSAFYEVKKVENKRTFRLEVTCDVTDEDTIKGIIDLITKK